MMLYLFVYLIAAFVNHIDDTDETYGYFEPLHYLFAGYGMQTWEYSPNFAIRTYAFITPLLGVMSVLKALLVNHPFIPKLAYFSIAKVILGLVTAFSSQTFENSIRSVFGDRQASIFKYLMLLSPGIFYASTSFLPSAVCMSLVMLSFAKLLSKQYFISILYGCIAVLWTGWPFVGVVFLPIGVTILLDIGLHEGIRGIAALAIKGAAILTIVLLSAATIDICYYKQR